ncbi:excinuclease ABC subunit A [Candidatus Kuenenbacteria bacterium RIFCSPLOWO2_12_FULL_42_13]|uniref:UvrABC system protein A n=3 Tax=Candidatus Kueneniibacteriota TaxID=1752740 RepID=A0A0G0YZM5_9BACT|nr:MAG: UvrABC system protein A [Candidatus Kuenenbacteria bacterium GW2011_GWA2_42_15]OGG89650.1 MAG: excinuclease ABC subunit A [Candidatus Kuenenbacteria bacterium RIFCSPHIGHO2_02_FULL_42_29]OGG91000.1 MAG: excinuclease ABC subunit A [Candidatus Kuenenbacteria bacterium RIFCSPLOWO2_02_FULL_42_16]OGG91335.1 MAG: excinuclease ABC subunit A [Candidatus Kuenenbacteria bacterium RIFCSPLOWO2_12_FULL_42_13]
MVKMIKVRGARAHNLKNIDVDIPKDKLVVITGLSGSGKSSLAFDTLYVEGQRLYVESLSAYAKQLLGLKDRADVDKIEGLSPAIAIDQRPATNNPRSTVGTMTEIYDYLRVLFARVGVPHCSICGEAINKRTKEQLKEQIWRLHKEESVFLLAPVVINKKGSPKHILEKMRDAKYGQVRLDGYFCSIEEALQTEGDKNKKHFIEIVIGGFGSEEKKERDGNLFYKSLDRAFDLGNGTIAVYATEKEQTYVYSNSLTCPKCNVGLASLEPNIFSFNSPLGACIECGGLGVKLEVDLDLVIPNKNLSLVEGAVRAWSRMSGNIYENQMSNIVDLARRHGFSIETPVKSFEENHLKAVFYGDKSEGRGGYEGIANVLLRKYKETESEYVRGEIEKYMSVKKCGECHGKRLKSDVLNVLIGDKSISDLAQINLKGIVDFFKRAKFTKREEKIALPLIKEISRQLQVLLDIGLDYLTLDRSAATLSGGEAAKIRLATQITSKLTGVLYVLDEPSIGLHERDNNKLIKILRDLRDLGNTVVVVEHDATIIKAADWVVDMGPGAGKHGGEVVAAGRAADISRQKKSLTGDYLAGRKTIPMPNQRRSGNGKRLEIKGAQEFNLKNIDVAMPLGKMICVTGVSGSGKSTLVEDILSRGLAKHFYQTKDAIGKHQEIKGLEFINKAVTINQLPIGRTPRSNAATYTGVFTNIRELFAEQPEARIKGLDQGYFSFNVRGGRCEACQGDGTTRVEMNFWPDLYLECEECHGRRYNSEALEVYWRGKNIADVLEMTAEDALEFFNELPLIKAKLKVLNEVGLGYLRLGQPAPTLSGGEAQRVKLATELSRRDTGKTVYILDEPTIGLHFEDVRKLLNILNKLVDKGNTVIVVEHNMEMIKCADYVIDLGPAGGDKGGEIVAVGTPEEVAKVKRSYTGQFLKGVLQNAKTQKAPARLASESVAGRQ